MTETKRTILGIFLNGFTAGGCLVSAAECLIRGYVVLGIALGVLATVNVIVAYVLALPSKTGKLTWADV